MDPSDTRRNGGVLQRFLAFLVGICNFSRTTDAGGSTANERLITPTPSTANERSITRTRNEDPEAQIPLRGSTALSHPAPSHQCVDFCLRLLRTVFLFRRFSLEGEEGDGNHGVEPGRWSEFYKDAISALKWVKGTVFVFVPLKRSLHHSNAASSDCSWEFLIDFISGLSLPTIVLVTMCIHTGFHLAWRGLRNLKIRFVFQLLSLVFGFAIGVEGLVFIGGDEALYTFLSIVVFLLFFWLCKIWDLCL